MVGLTPVKPGWGTALEVVALILFNLY